MTSPACAACATLQKPLRIVTPRDLTRVNRVARKHVANGALQEDSAQDCNPYGGPFRQLPETPPWSDFLDYRFRCTHCGRVYSLACDTYHGNGRWEQV